jgi:peptide/nickel transport system permease protein
MTSSARSRRYALLRARLVGFWVDYKRNKKGILGIGIIVFFILFAAFGPMLSPYDPVNDWDVGGRRVPPAWFKFLPGNEKLVPNLNPIKNVGFSSPQGIAEWEFVEGVEDIMSVSHSEEGYEGGSRDGSMLVSVKRSSAPPEEIDFSVVKTFEWPHDNPPKRFRSDLAIKVEGADGYRIRFSLAFTTPQEEIILWTKRVSGDSDWFTPEFKVDSYSLRIKMLFPDGVFADPAASIFQESGEYKFSLVASIDPGGSDEQVDTRIYIDELKIEMMGTCFGLLGTDQWGRDVYSQLSNGAKISLSVGLLSAFISVSIGLLVGLFAGFMGGMVDEVSMRFADMLLIIPYLPLLMILIAILGQSIWNIIIIISVLGWMSFSRIVRSQVLSLKERAFIEAARASGGSTTHIILRHILPNVMGLVFVSLATNVPASISAEASLSFLGLGDPKIMSWGQMLHDIVYYAAIKELYWVVPPGLCIALLALSFVMMGFSLDEILNPRLRRR